MQSQPEFCLVLGATGPALSVSRSLTQVQSLSEAYEALMVRFSVVGSMSRSAGEAVCFLLDERAFA
jgi:hypothetical protein